METDTFQHPRLKFRQHIHVAALRIEILVQYRTEQAQFANTALPAKTSDLLAVNLNGQFGNGHADIFAEIGKFCNR